MDKFLVLNLLIIVISGFIVFKLFELENKLEKSNRSSSASPSKDNSCSMFKPIPTSIGDLLSGIKKTKSKETDEARVVELPEDEEHLSRTITENEEDTCVDTLNVDTEMTPLKKVEEQDTNPTRSTNSKLTDSSSKQRLTRNRKQQKVAFAEDDSDEEGPP